MKTLARLPQSASGTMALIRFSARVTKDNTSHAPG